MFIESGAILKGIGAIGCFYGAYSTWRTFPIPANRSKLMECFKLGNLCVVHKKSKREVKKYPAIEKVSISHDCVLFRFTIPDGLDPNDIHKHEWLFKQKFGDHITINGDVKHFTLCVYPQKIETFDYKPIETGKHKLPIYVGKSRTGIEIYDMVEHPHLLLSGETGSGKSVELRSILTTLILNLPPHRLHLYLGDMKRSEFHLFKDIEHVQKLAMDPINLTVVLKQIRKIMKQRGSFLDAYEESHIDDLPKEKQLPYIILCIDEVALLQKEKEAMEIIEEIAAIGRALGVFLILSMQRPDADVLDGKLKQCLTVRISGRQDNEMNSRIALGVTGAENISEVDKGMLLFKFKGLQRVQAPYLSLKEAKKLLKPYKKKIPLYTMQEDGNDGEDDFGVLDDD